MKKYLVVFILSLTFVFLPASYAASYKRVSKNCTFNFQMNNGKVYSFSNIRDFIADQIRPGIKATSNFTVYIVRKCRGKVARLSIEMSPKNLYILAINGGQLSKDVTSYTNQNLPLSKAEFSMIYNEAWLCCITKRSLVDDKIQATRRDFGIPSDVILFNTLQPIVASCR